MCWLCNKFCTVGMQNAVLSNDLECNKFMWGNYSTSAEILYCFNWNIVVKGQICHRSHLLASSWIGAYLTDVPSCEIFLLDQLLQKLHCKQTLMQNCYFLTDYFIVSRIRQAHLEFLKLFLVFASFSLADLQYVETHCFTEWTALTNCHHITQGNIPTTNQYKQVKIESSKKEV